ncbi:unnamed protein product [Adineta steineri]|uniref:Uncharacterized protein n=1 Tax=Adineta steineri TaxID=433720 RepID=A0A815WJJ5_9BILA|nr:unnamed protein product [Adineta steineri]CAF1658155.1 unnamed protein product [Adineta steineri]
MADLTSILKAELGVKSHDQHHHHDHHHQHDKIIVPSSMKVKNDTTHELQSQLGHGKELDEEIQHEKDKVHNT